MINSSHKSLKPLTPLRRPRQDMVEDATFTFSGVGSCQQQTMGCSVYGSRCLRFWFIGAPLQGKTHWMVFGENEWLAWLNKQKQNDFWPVFGTRTEAVTALYHLLQTKDLLYAEEPPI